MSGPCPNKACKYPCRRDFVETANGVWKCKVCENTIPKHSHRWRINGWSSKTIHELCTRRGCGARRQREPSALEAKQIEASHKRMLKPPAKYNIHRVWHDFTKRFMTNNGPGSFKGKGWPLMKEVEKWAKKFPNDVRIVSCDDNHFTGSSIVVIDHKSTVEWMGATCVVIPQCGGPPCEFFLYPHHANEMLAALRGIKKTTKILQKKAKQWRKDMRAKNPFMR